MHGATTIEINILLARVSAVILIIAMMLGLQLNARGISLHLSSVLLALACGHCCCSRIWII